MDQTIVHPALVESRQLRLAQLRLLSAIEIEEGSSARSKAGKAAATARWGEQKRPRRGGGR